MERTQLASSRMEEQNEKQPKDETEGNRENKRPGNLRRKQKKEALKEVARTSRGELQV